MKNNLYKLKLKSLSKVIISPRSSKTMYKDVDFDSKILGLNKEKISIIYPFYSYNERKINMNVKDINYYLPGSSIKGVFFSKEKNIMCDDVKLKKDDIILDWVYKIVDYNEEINYNKLEVPKIPKYKKFFENTCIEMLNSEINFEAIIRIFNSDKNSISKKLEGINENTIKKLKIFTKKVEKVLETTKTISQKYKKNKTELDTLKEELEKILGKLKQIIEKYKNNNEKRFIAFLGGFKGKVGAISNIKENVQTGLYFDNETKLPYGLVEIENLL